MQLGRRIAFLLSFLATFCQAQYTLELQELRFHSELEESFFKGDRNDFITGLLIVDPLQNSQTVGRIRNDVDVFIDKIVAKSVNKSTKRQAKYVFDAVHNEFFSVYEDVAMFNEIFERKAFNCVSGSALYGLVFSELGVPFRVISTNDHVFLVLTPNEGMYLVESTDPVKGYQADFDKQQERLLKDLERYKLIDQEGNLTTSIGEANQEVAFGDLAAMQYWNSAVIKHGAGDLKEAIEMAKKAHFLSSNPDLFLAGLYSFYYQAYSQNNLGPELRSKYLYEIARIDTTVDAITLRKELIELSDLALRTGDKELIGRVCDPFRGWSRSELNLPFIENAFYAQYYLENGTHQEAEPFILEAYAADQKNEWLKSAIARVLTAKAMDVNDLENAIEDLEVYIDTNPHLQEDAVLNEVLLIYFLVHSANYFVIDDTLEAMYYLEAADALLESGLRANPDVIGGAYYEAWRHFTRKNKNAQANHWARRGLEFNKFHRDLNRVVKY